MAQITKIADRKYFVRISKGSGKSRTQISRTIRGTREDAKKWANKQETALDLGGCNFGHKFKNERIPRRLVGERIIQESSKGYLEQL
jgi:hypothetical protein